MISKKFKLLWRLRCTVLFIILITVCIILIDLSSWFCIITVALISIVYLTAVLWLVSFYYKRLSVSINDNKIIIERGIFFYKSICMSCDKIQCIKRILTPLGQITDTCDCIFYFTTASFYVSGIDVKYVQNFIK